MIHLIATRARAVTLVSAVVVPMADIAGKDRHPGADSYPGLFPDLPLCCFTKGLSQLEAAAWNGPQTAGGRHPSPDEKDTALSQNDSPHPNPRTIGIFTTRHKATLLIS